MINIYLITTILLVLFILFLIFVFMISDENKDAQPYLYKFYNKIKYYSQDSIINPNYTLIKNNDIFVLNNFLNKNYFYNLKKIFNNKHYKSNKINILVTQRSGTGIDFFQLHEQKEYHKLLELYYSNHLINTISKIVNKPVQRVSLSDNNACSLLIYNNKGDNIGWHYDNSNYYGDRYVVLLTIINENKEKNGLSDNIFQYQYDNKINSLKMKENSLIIFKGSEVLHQSTAIANNERRILLSMVFCDICQEKKNIFTYYLEKIKTNVLYGYS